MSETETTVNLFLLDHYDRNGYSINQNGGYFKNGLAYSVEKKAKVAQAYYEAFLLEDGRPNVASLAKELKVSNQYIFNVENEIMLTVLVLVKNSIIAQ